MTSQKCKDATILGAGYLTPMTSQECKKGQILQYKEEVTKL